MKKLFNRGTKFKTGKLHRWAIRLQEFDFVCKWIPGALNTFADYLSRDGANVNSDLPINTDVSKVNTFKTPKDAHFIHRNKVKKFKKTRQYQRLKRKQNKILTNYLDQQKYNIITSDIPRPHKHKNCIIYRSKQILVTQGINWGTNKENDISLSYRTRATIEEVDSASDGDSDNDEPKIPPTKQTNEQNKNETDKNEPNNDEANKNKPNNDENKNKPRQI